MRRIFKYGLPVFDGEVGIMLPGEPRFLWVDFQGTMLCLWAEVDPTALPTVHRFGIIMTGEQVPDGGEYIGSAQIKDPRDPFVAHLYRLP